MITNFNDFITEAKKYGIFASKPNWGDYLTNKFDDDVKSCVYDYVAGNTTAVNNYLRAGMMKEAEPITSIMDKAFNTKKKMDVYRTVDIDYMKNVHGFDPKNPDMFISKVLVLDAYTSTSIVLQSPWGHHWMADDVIFHITSEKEIPYIDVNDMFDADDIDCEHQEEYILPRDIKIQIKDIKVVNKKNDKRFSQSGNFFIEATIL